MQELKIMIQKAAHLSKINFSLFIDGEDYTHYTDETFDSLFPPNLLKKSCQHKYERRIPVNGYFVK